MDVIFNCPHCDQELTVDSSGSGTAIDCPTCGQKILIPEPTLQSVHPVNPMATSAAAKVERHFAVPVHDAPSESLIGKPLVPLEIAAREGIHLRIKTIRHSDCVEVGKDHFDEVATKFLDKIGEANVVSISTFTYSHQDLASREWVADYGILVVYKG